MRIWTLIAGGLAGILSIQAVACTQPTTDEVGVDRAPLQASVTIGGKRMAAPVVDAETYQRGLAFIRDQSGLDSETPSARLEDGRQVVLLSQRQEGSRITARGYIVEANGARTPFSVENFAPSFDPQSQGGLQPRGWGLIALAALVIIVVVVIVVAPPIINSMQCDARSTGDCLCQKALPEPTACSVSGSVNEAGTGVEACAEVTKGETKCVCRPRDPASTVNCESLSDP